MFAKALGSGGACRKILALKDAGYVSVRNYRKPRWVPIAKSKMFKIYEIPPPPKLEHEETTALDTAYDTYSRSLWAFQGEISREKEVQIQKHARQISEEVELERMIKINDAENDRIRKLREEALIMEWKETEKEILEIKALKEEEELLKLEKTEAFIKTELERLNTAIPQDQVDLEIEKALATEVDYNFAISKDGKYFLGRHNSEKPADEQPSVESKIGRIKNLKNSV